MGCLALGDDLVYKKKIPTKDDDGKVITENPNFITNPVKKGNIDDVLFSAPGYTCLGDKYQDPQPLLRQQKKDGWKKVADLPFKPAGQVGQAVAADYEHITDFKYKKKNYRNEDGAVITAPKNFTTNHPKKGNPATTTGILFQKEFYEHMAEPYDLRKDLMRKEL